MGNQISKEGRPTATTIEDTDYYVLDRGVDGQTMRITGATLKLLLASDEFWEAGAGTNSLKDKRAGTANGNESTSIGPAAKADGLNSLALSIRAEAIGDSSNAIGDDSRARIEKSTNIAGPIFIKRTDETSNNNAYHFLSGTAVYILSAETDLTATGLSTMPFPAGVRFFPDEVGLIITAIDNLSGNPSVEFGETGDNDKLADASPITGLTAAGDRHRDDNLKTDNGITSFVANITTAATADELKGRFYIKGFIVENEA
jgi:hypothetical protein